MRDLQLLLQHLFHPAWQRWVRFDISGLEHLPARGPGVVAFNHRSYADFFVLAQLVRRGGRPLRMLAKKELFDVPLVGAICNGMGGIPVDRAAPGDAPYATAVAALQRGDLVGLMPQGTIRGVPPSSTRSSSASRVSSGWRRRPARRSSPSGSGAPRCCGRDRRRDPACRAGSTTEPVVDFWK